MADSLIHLIKVLALVAVAAVCASVVWIVFSWIFYGFRIALEAAGLKVVFRQRRLLRASRNLLRWPAKGFSFVKDRVGFLNEGPSVRVVVDQRLAQVKDTLDRARKAVNQACDAIIHFGQGGTAALSADIMALQKKAEDAATLGGEIPEDILSNYQARSSNSFNIFFGFVLLIGMTIGNGVFFNRFASELVHGTVAYFNVPTSLLFSFIVVLAEAAAGWFIGQGAGHGPRKTIPLLLATGLFMAVLSAGAECWLTALLSAQMDLDIPVVDSHPIMKFGLALLGPVLAFATVGLSFGVHRLVDLQADTIGAKKLRKDVKDANAFVQSLPQHWEGIRDKARQANSALQVYSTGLDARDGVSQTDGVIGGLVRDIEAERQSLLTAIDQARVGDWKQLIEGATADNNWDSMRNAVIFIATGVILYVGVIALSAFFAVALRGLITLPGMGWIGAAFLFAATIYSVGFLSFGRLQIVDSSGRVFPYRHGVSEYAFAIAASCIGGVGLLWGGYLAFHWLGLLVGLVLIAACGVLVFLGYFFERSCRGLFFLLAIGGIAGGAIIATGAAAFVLLVMWPAAILFWTVWVILSFLGWPTALAVRWWRSSRQNTSAPVAPQLAPVSP